MSKEYISFVLILYWLSIVCGQRTYSMSEMKADVNNDDNNGNDKQNMPSSANYHMNMDETNMNTLFNTNLNTHRDRDDLMNMKGNIQNIQNRLTNYDDNKENYGKRVERYIYGLGHKAFTYANDDSGKKRFPVYNFGLGKRARPYSFGLGKRSSPDYNDDDITTNDLDFDMDNALKAVAILLANEKRSRPYSFGLGKRISTDPPENGPMRFNFGLGH